KQWQSQMVVPDKVEKGNRSHAITSTNGAFKPSVKRGTYRMSKLAQIGLCRNLAAEVQPKRNRFNAITPGLVTTELAREMWDNQEVEKRN
ncbi:SDR family oxidoreductase, partial [Marimonas sp. MJW-29]